MKSPSTMIVSMWLCLAVAWAPFDKILAASSFADSSAERVLLQKNLATDVIPPLTSSASPLFRDVPSISGRYSVGDMTFLPYFGAGFGAGYTSELDRSFAPSLQHQQNMTIGGQSELGMVPNEFQMGIRIPF
jgi:hypothetical protein